MSASVWLAGGGVAFLVYGLLVAPRRRRVPLRRGRPLEEASGRHVPPACPPGLPLAAAITDRLVAAGFSPAEVHAWWWRPRWELDGATPRQATLDGGSRWVLELAEHDAYLVGGREVSA